MKKIATTVFNNEEEHIAINEYENGTFEKVVNEEEVSESSLEEIQELVDSGKYTVNELTW